MTDSAVFDLSQYPVALGLGATATAQERFTGDMAWYERLIERTKDDGREGRLVSMHRFAGSWDSWEVHPEGHELVVCVAGRMTVVQEQDGRELRHTLEAGEAIINPPGVWHTADVEDAATAVFVTAGLGTSHRPR